MIKNLRVGFRDGMVMQYYDSSPLQLNIQTTNFIIKINFLEEFSREWLIKLFAVDLQKITEHDFILYVDFLLEHVALVKNFEVIRKFDNKVVREHGLN